MKQLPIALFAIQAGFYCHGQAKQIKNEDQQTQIGQNNKWIRLENKESIDGYTRLRDSIFGGEISCNVSPIKNIDVATFMVNPGSKYAKDKNCVYYPLKINCIDKEDCGACYYSEVIIKGANPKTFVYLGKDYAKDDRAVYFRGKALLTADSKTFKVINGPEFFYFAKDKNNVFRYDHIFPNAAPATFYYDKEVNGNSDSKYVIGDKNSKWEYTPPDEIVKLKD